MSRHPALADPTLANLTAPATFAVELITTNGPIVLDVDRALAPVGADRFFNLVRRWLGPPENAGR